VAKSKPLPAPRLQLRWEEGGDTGWAWQCHYELVLPLDKYDVRAEQQGPRGGRRPNLTELVIPIKEPSLRSGGGTPCTAQDGTRYYDSPYRDGAHAIWDAKLIGNPPIYVIGLDGMAFKYEPKQAATPPQGTAS
jgi:hypothetical protein